MEKEALSRWGQVEKGTAAFRTWHCAGSIHRKPGDPEAPEERSQGIIWALVLVIRGGGKGHCVNAGCSAQHQPRLWSGICFHRPPRQDGATLCLNQVGGASVCSARGAGHRPRTLCLQVNAHTAVIPFLPCIFDLSFSIENLGFLLLKKKISF